MNAHCGHRNGKLPIHMSIYMVKHQLYKVSLHTPAYTKLHDIHQLTPIIYLLYLPANIYRQTPIAHAAVQNAIHENYWVKMLPKAELHTTIAQGCSFK